MELRKGRAGRSYPAGLGNWSLSPGCGRKMVLCVSKNTNP